MPVKRTAEAIWIESKSYWQIKVQKDGVRKAFTSSIKGRKGKHAAEAKADEWLEKGTQDMRFPAAWELFLADIKKRTGTSNYANTESYGRLYILPTVGNKKLSSITPVNWQDCIGAGAQKGLSRRSCKNIKSSIRAFLRYAKRARWEVCQVEPDDITIPNSAAPAKPKIILQPDEIRLLFSESTILKWGKPVIAHYIFAWRFFVATGLRRGELCGLRRENVSHGVLTICRSINKFEEETFGKNDNARRSIKVTAIMREILDDQAEYMRQIGVISPWIFPDEDGERSDPKIVASRWRVYRTQHGLNSSIHELRHTFVSINKAMPQELMKSTVGHSSSMNTYGVYGHEVDGETDIAANIIEHTFDQILSQK